MGKNKLQKFADMATYSHVFEVDFTTLQSVGFKQCGHWHEWFGNNNPIVVELGCGRGEYTVGLARLNPQVNYIGIDIKGARMHTGATEALNEGLTNVAFVRTRIEFVDRLFAPDEVSQIWITFPDPQMRKARKRLVGTLMLSRYKRFLAPEGVVHLKTDSPFLYAYMQAMLSLNHITPQTLTADLYADQSLAQSMLIKTYYEQKWLDAGMSIKYVRFTLPDAQLVEPDVDIQHDNYHNVGRNVRFKE